MKKIGMIFPGQGSQSLGMGKDLYDKHRIVQELFEEASSCLDQNFVRLCFASSDRELKETINAQTSVFLVSAAIFSLLKTKYNIKPEMVAGHGSGEYAALYAAGGITFADALYLLKKRGTFMDEVTRKHPGTMMSVMNVPYNTLRDVCSEVDNGEPELVAEIACYNSSNQFIVSGTELALERVAYLIRPYGGKPLMLNVAGAFHSRLMKEAADLFALYMVKVDFKDLEIPLVNNINAEIVTTHEQVHASIKEQMISPILWRQAMERLRDCDIILEIGADDLLAKLLSREWPDKHILAIHTEKDIEKLLYILEKDVVKRQHHPDCDRENCALEELVVVDPETGALELVNRCSGEKDITIEPQPIKEEQPMDQAQEQPTQEDKKEGED